MAPIRIARGPLAADERGVSEVIGTLLLLGITVIGATLVGAAAFATVQDNIDGGPLVDADIRVEGSAVAVEHGGGDALPLDELDVVVSNGTDDRRVTLSNASALVDAVGDGDDRFEPGETVRVDRELTGELDVVLVHTRSNTVIGEEQQRDATTTATTATTTTAVADTPSVDSLTLQETGSQNRRIQVDVEVSDPAGDGDDLDTVEVEAARASDGQVRYTATLTASGDSAVVSDTTDQLNQKKYHVTVTVTDASGNTDSKTKTIDLTP